jgi:hypothetical protein
MAQLATLSRSHTVARPIKVLVPLIKEDLRRGDTAGMEYYRKAGDKLREARPQVPSHRWTQFLTTNFAISKTTAWRYMRASEIYEDNGETGDRSRAETLRALTGEAPKERSRRQHERRVFNAIGNVDVDHLAQREADTRREEIELHRTLALELIDIGYKALAMRLHPDRGGSREGMRRLNRVRDELKAVATTRRFE